MDYVCNSFYFEVDIDCQSLELSVLFAFLRKLRTINVSTWLLNNKQTYSIIFDIKIIEKSRRCDRVFILLFIKELNNWLRVNFVIRLIFIRFDRNSSTDMTRSFAIILLVGACVLGVQCGFKQISLKSSLKQQFLEYSIIGDATEYSSNCLLIEIPSH